MPVSAKHIPVYLASALIGAVLCYLVVGSISPGDALDERSVPIFEEFGRTQAQQPAQESSDDAEAEKNHLPVGDLTRLITPAEPTADVDILGVIQECPDELLGSTMYALPIRIMPTAFERAGVGYDSASAIEVLDTWYRQKREDAAEISFGTIGPDGSFRIPVHEQALHLLILEKSGYRLFVSGTSRSSAMPEVEVQARALPLRLVRIVALDEEGKPLTIPYKAWFGEPAHSARMSNRRVDPAYPFVNVHESSRVICISDDGGRSASRFIDIVPQEGEIQEVELTLGTGSWIEVSGKQLSDIGIASGPYLYLSDLELNPRLRARHQVVPRSIQLRRLRSARDLAYPYIEGRTMRIVEIRTYDRGIPQSSHGEYFTAVSEAVRLQRGANAFSTGLPEQMPEHALVVSVLTPDGKPASGAIVEVARGVLHSRQRVSWSSLGTSQPSNESGRFIFQTLETEYTPKGIAVEAIAYPYAFRAYHPDYGATSSLLRSFESDEKQHVVLRLTNPQTAHFRLAGDWAAYGEGGLALKLDYRGEGDGVPSYSHSEVRKKIEQTDWRSFDAQGQLNVSGLSPGEYYYSIGFRESPGHSSFTRGALQGLHSGLIKVNAATRGDATIEVPVCSSLTVNVGNVRSKASRVYVSYNGGKGRSSAYVREGKAVFPRVAHREYELKFTYDDRIRRRTIQVTGDTEIDLLD